MYFWITTYVQIFSVEKIIQPDFVANDFASIWMCFSPHPPWDFGLARISQVTQDETKESELLEHKNLKNILFSWSYFTSGIHAKGI